MHYRVEAGEAATAREPALIFSLGFRAAAALNLAVMPLTLRWPRQEAAEALKRPLCLRADAGGATTQTFSFWLPGLGQPMHWAYTSCAGMSVDVAPSAPELQDPTYLWRDLLQVHSAFPMHCLVGGGADSCRSQGCGRGPRTQGNVAFANGHYSLDWPCSSLPLLHGTCSLCFTWSPMLCTLMLDQTECTAVPAGDQLYNDAVWQCPTLKAWGASRDL